MRRPPPFLILGCLLLSPAAGAGKFYVGAAAGEATLEAPAGDVRLSVDDTGHKVFLGFRVARWLAVEGGYTDLGNLNGTGGDVAYEAQADLLSAFTVVALPITPRARLFGKIGLASWDVLSTTAEGDVSEGRDASGIDLAFGFGLGYDLTRRLGLRVEWETCDFDNTEDVRFISLGAQFSF